MEEIVRAMKKWILRVLDNSDNMEELAILPEMIKLYTIWYGI